MARAADEQEFENARGQFDSSQYAAAAARFGKLLDPTTPICPKTPDLTAEGCRLSDPALVQRARSYYASSLVALGRDDEAASQIENILRDSPTLPPSPAIFSQRGIDLYLKVREKMEGELVKKALQDQKRKKEYEDSVKRYDAWVAGVAKIAATETVVTPRSRWIAALPFGVGQFQNQDEGLGVFFLSLEGAEVTTSIVTGILHAQLVTDASHADGDSAATCAKLPAKVCATTSSSSQTVVASELSAQLERLRIANQISIAALAATIIAGLIEAEVSSEDETVTTRPRDLPKRPPKPDAPPVSARIIGVPAAPDAQGIGLELRF